MLVIIAAIAMRGSGGGGGSGTTAPTPAFAPSLPGPPIDHVEVHYPPNLTGKSGRDFEKVVDRIYKGDYDSALRELDKWENKYGQRDETIDLRDQLNRVPRQPEHDEE